MSVKTEYKCDLCGKVQDSENGMWSVMVCVEEGCGKRTSQGCYSFYSNKYADWCSACLEKNGFLQVNKVKGEEIKEITIEELVRKMAREEIRSTGE